MSEQLQDNNPRGVLSGFVIAIISALFSTLFFASFTTLVYIKNMPFGKPQAVIVQIVSVIIAVALAQFLSRKIQGDKLSMMQALLIGWLSSLILGMFIATFYTIFSSFTNQNLMQKGAFAMLLLLYNGLGLVWSIIIGVILKKE
jgi:cobalamin synthase